MDIDLRGFLRSSLNEWEGRVAAVVFTGRCNWRCPYCHGKKLVLEPETLPPVDPETVLAFLREQVEWIDGLAVTGGEPTLQPGLPNFLRQVKAIGVAVKLESNGTRPEVIEALLREKLIDCLCFDYKAPLDERLAAVARVEGVAADPAAVRKSFALAAASGIEREYHTTLWPGAIDRAAMEAMAKALEPGGLWVLQQFEPGVTLDPAAAGTRRFDPAELAALEKIAREQHERVLLRAGMETATA